MGVRETLAQKSSWMVNPYAVTSHVDTAERAYGDHARLVQSSFLFRVIEFDRPFEGRLRYSCWWWRQRIEINGHRVWFRAENYGRRSDVGAEQPRS